MTEWFRIDYPKTPAGKREWNRRYGLNAYYSGKHPAVRAKDARYWHDLTAVYLAKAKVRKEPFTKPVKITFYWNDNLDIDNHAIMGKMILDGLKGRLIHDDSRKWVKSIEHAWHDEDFIGIYLSEVNVTTNADRIRGMADEELANWIHNRIRITLERAGFSIDEDISNEDVVKSTLDWLQQPAETEGTE